MAHEKEHFSFRKLSRYFDNVCLDKLFISVSIRSVALSLVNVFVPIYLYELGFSISEIALFYIVFYLSVSIIQPFAMKLISILGIKTILSLGTIGLSLYYLGLTFIDSGNINYLTVALIFGFSIAFYFAAYHIIFSRCSDKNEEGVSTSLMSIFSGLFSAAGPLIGSLFISRTSFDNLFVLVLIILLLSLIPILMMRDMKIDVPKFNLKRVFKTDSWQKALTYQAEGISGLAGIIFWPLFIFMILKEIFSLGIILSVTSVLMIIISLFVGFMADKYKIKLLRIGIIFNSISWILRLLFLNPIGVFVTNLYSSVSSSFIGTPFARRVYSDSKNSKYISDYFLFREFNLEIGRILALLVIFFTNNIYWIFIVAFLTTFVFYVLPKQES